MRIAISKHGRSAIVAGLAAAGALMDPPRLPLSGPRRLCPDRRSLHLADRRRLLHSRHRLRDAGPIRPDLGDVVIRRRRPGDHRECRLRGDAELPPPAPDTPSGRSPCTDDRRDGARSDKRRRTWDLCHRHHRTVADRHADVAARQSTGWGAGLYSGRYLRGKTTITAKGGLFRINSFFDVFVEISIPGATSPPVGPITLVAVPEPSTWAMLLTGFAGLGFAGWRRAAGLAG